MTEHVDRPDRTGRYRSPYASTFVDVSGQPILIIDQAFGPPQPFGDYRPPFHTDERMGAALAAMHQRGMKS